MMRQTAVFVVILILSASVAQAEEVKLRLLPKGAMRKMGGYRPQRIQLNDEKPDTVKKAPKLESPLFGVLEMGASDKPRSYIVALDEPEEGDAQLFVDSNGNGDLTDDEPAVWKKRSVRGRDGKASVSYGGEAAVTLKYGDDALTVTLGMYRFDKNDPKRAATKDVMFYYADYAFEGSIHLGDKQFDVLLVDQNATGDFRGDEETEGGSGVRLLIDLNGNSRFESREGFDVREPFNIGGTTYEIADLHPSGKKLSVRKSSKKVKETPMPPDLSVGKPAPKFTARLLNGKKLSFPDDYEGKIVLVDFWATWCGPCVASIPHVVEAYEKHHKDGLEVLGISLDKEDKADHLKKFTKDKEMPWPQVYDGKYWKAEVAVLYDVHAIPFMLLIDGDTGKILASGARLSGEQLSRTIAAELKKKKSSRGA